MNHALNRPTPLTRPAARPIDRHTPSPRAAARLRDGETLMVTDHYSTGEEILAQLQALLGAPPATAPYPVRRAHQRTYREAALRLLAPIKQHQLALQGGTFIGFLEELYPEQASFALPFVQVQELHGAWLRFRDGVPLAVLGQRLHPYYGTYVPTRTSHLELFGTWLSADQGARSSAIDVGTGCGVLALMLCRAGVGKVLATDISPNAIESVSREIKRRAEAPPPITLWCGDLLEGITEPADLIVFNPPWMQGAQEGLLDQALYFEDGLFERFFAQAAARLTPEGRIVMLFSNVIQLVQPHVPHPIEAELARGRLRLVQRMQRKIKPEAGQRRTRERVEVWELARA